MSAASLSLLALLPLGFIIWVTFETGWATASALVFRPRVGELLLNTALLLGCAVPLSALLAVTLAWLTERTDLPGARLWSWLVVAPLAIPAFVHSYAWVSMVPDVCTVCRPACWSPCWPTSRSSICRSRPQLRRLDPAIEDAAASLGLGPWRVFLRVVLPQLRLALCGGSLLVGLHLLAEYGLFAMIRFDTFTTAIVDQFQSAYATARPPTCWLACWWSAASACSASKGWSGVVRGMPASAPEPPDPRAGDVWAV